MAARSGDGTDVGMQLAMADDKGKSRLQQQIDENLRLVYEETLKEAVPDRFMDLIRRLRDVEAGVGGARGAGGEGLGGAGGSPTGRPAR